MLPPRRPVITITTDFGLTDGYVGAVKGVLLSICPDATLVDVTHLVPPQDVSTGALILRQAAPFFPPETIHLAVIDPGVGTARRAVALSGPLGTFVGPDNGLFTGVIPASLTQVRAVELNRHEYWLPAVSATFQGRDVFAPVAAHLAAGVTLRDVGEPIDAASLVRLPWPAPAIGCGRLTGEVIHVDHFGNLITNIERQHIPDGAPVTVRLGERLIGPLAATYGDSRPGEAIACIGSSGFLEIAVVNGHAGNVLGAGRSCPVTVSFTEE